ncbi:MAG: FAD-binding protein [Theionarchaea archaeon]|nr:FAD-binding protein [Theionarchaea archaeon]MBU7036686.1 FAD-binding protein [Theionarchaea archaeon]
MKITTVEKAYDIVVVGGGGAGAQAALSASATASDLKIALVDKGILGRSGCTILGSFSCNAALGSGGSGDSPRAHFLDTIKEGRYINDQSLVRVYTEKAPERVVALHREGPVFEEEDGELKQDMVPGHSFPRAVFNNLHTGKSMIVALMKQVKRAPIDVYDECMIFDVVCEGNEIRGVVAYDLAGRIIVFSCKAVIIAAGGCGQLYPHSTTSRGATGDGLVLAYKAGAELQDLEFIQFFPTAQCYPRLLKLNPTIPSMLRYKGGCRLYNAEGHEFMKEKNPQWRFSVTRDELSKAIYTEIKEGRGTPHGGVYMDVLHLTEQEITDIFSFANLFDDLLKTGIDLRKDRIETTVAAHFSMGGIRVDETFATCVGGLFAAGEAAAGIHGANRLPGNALSEILVTGHEAGRRAAEYARKTEFHEIEGTESVRKIEGTMERTGDSTPIAMKKEIQRTLWEHAGVVRNEKGLMNGIATLERIREDMSRVEISTETLVWNKELVDFLEMEFMVEMGLLLTRAALFRTESRGSHFREDYPESDSSWIVNVVLRNGTCRREPVMMEESDD